MFCISALYGNPTRSYPEENQHAMGNNCLMAPADHPFYHTMLGLVIRLSRLLKFYLVSFLFFYDINTLLIYSCSEMPSGSRFEGNSFCFKVAFASIASSGIGTVYPLSPKFNV